MGRKRAGLTYLLRNILLETKRLKEWLRNINPNIILQASGDYRIRRYNGDDLGFIQDHSLRQRK